MCIAKRKLYSKLLYVIDIDDALLFYRFQIFNCSCLRFSLVVETSCLPANQSRLRSAHSHLANRPGNIKSQLEVLLGAWSSDASAVSQQRSD